MVWWFFVYVPKGKVDLPLFYFRLNNPNLGQFERTLIIADEGSQVHYVEGCTPTTPGLPNVIEIIKKECHVVIQLSNQPTL